MLHNSYFHIMHRDTYGVQRTRGGREWEERLREGEEGIEGGEKEIEGGERGLREGEERIEGGEEGIERNNISAMSPGNGKWQGTLPSTSEGEPCRIGVSCSA